MTCHHPLTAYQQTEADLTISSQQYYKSKKLKFHEDKYHHKKIELACGHCLGCRLDHASMWADRITLESKNWQKNCVIALTYNDPNLPLSEKGKNTLVKKHLQDFLKRLRYHEKGFETWKHPFKGIEENPIRYFACGEYGLTGTRAGNGGNPHYHIVLFNYMPDDLKFYKLNKHGQPIYKSAKIQKIWGHGFITVEDFTYENASYVARYVQKKAGIEPQHYHYTNEWHEEWAEDERNGKVYEKIINKREKRKYDQEQEFIVMSRGVGIGRKYWEENKEKIKRNQGIYVTTKDGTKLKPIPKYFKKLWEKENYVEYYRFKYEREKDGIKRKMEIISQINLPGQTEEYIWSFYLKEEEKKLKQKATALKRNEFI